MIISEIFTSNPFKDDKQIDVNLIIKFEGELLENVTKRVEEYITSTIGLAENPEEQLEEYMESFTALITASLESLDFIDKKKVSFVQIDIFGEYIEQLDIELTSDQVIDLEEKAFEFLNKRNQNNLLWNSYMA